MMEHQQNGGVALITGGKIDPCTLWTLGSLFTLVFVGAQEEEDLVKLLQRFYWKRNWCQA